MAAEGAGAGRVLGVNRRTYPSRDRTRSGCSMTVVLVAGDIGDYAAYCGEGPPEWVAQYGDKLRFEEACCHFPGGQLERGRYRE